MNTYIKFCANTYLAKTKDKFNKHDEIIITTKRGVEHENIIFNLVKVDKDGFNYYSIMRKDGFNINVKRQNKADRYIDWAGKARDQSSAISLSSNEKDFLSLAEPVKVGHHSETKHRNLLKKHNNLNDKKYGLLEKADSHEEKAENLKSRTREINLSMPESLDYYATKLIKLKEIHLHLKNNKEAREHSMALAYANKDVKNCQEQVKLSKILWG